MLKLQTITKAQYELVGELILLFSQVEWLLANAILIIGTENYVSVQELDVTQKYFKTLVNLNYASKLDKIEQLGFNVLILRKVGKYRNTISHGLLSFENDQHISKSLGRGIEVNMSEVELKINIKLIQEEGQKILNFLNAKGFRWYRNSEETLK